MLTRFCATLAKICMMIAGGGPRGHHRLRHLCSVRAGYVLNDTPTWAEALAIDAGALRHHAGRRGGVRDAGHIGMESLLVLVKENVRLKLELVIHALVAVFGAIMAWNGAILAQSVWGYNVPR